MEKDGAKPMEMYCRDWGEMLAGVGADWEQPTGIRTAGQDDTFVSHLPASESQIVACLLTLKLSFSLCFFSLLVGIEPCRFKLVSYVSIAGIM